MNLFEIIPLVFLNAFLIIGFSLSTDFEYDENEINIATKKKGVKKDSRMILWWVRYYGDMVLSKFWRKPVYDCPTCMASLHSIYPYFLMNGFTTESLLFYPVYILSLAGLTTYFNSKL